MKIKDYGLVLHVFLDGASKNKEDGFVPFTEANLQKYLKNGPLHLIYNGNYLLDIFPLSENYKICMANHSSFSQWHEFISMDIIDSILDDFFPELAGHLPLKP